MPGVYSRCRTGLAPPPQVCQADLAGLVQAVDWVLVVVGDLDQAVEAQVWASVG